MVDCFLGGSWLFHFRARTLERVRNLSSQIPALVMSHIQGLKAVEVSEVDETLSLKDDEELDDKYSPLGVFKDAGEGEEGDWEFSSLCVSNGVLLH